MIHKKVSLVMLQMVLYIGFVRMTNKGKIDEPKILRQQCK